MTFHFTRGKAIHGSITKRFSFQPICTNAARFKIDVCCANGFNAADFNCEMNEQTNEERESGRNGNLIIQTNAKLCSESNNTKAASNYTK